MLKVRMCQTAFTLQMQMWTHAGVCISGFTSLFTVHAPLHISRGSGIFNSMQKTLTYTSLWWIYVLARVLDIFNMGRRLWQIIKISRSSCAIKILHGIKFVFFTDDEVYQCFHIHMIRSINSFLICY